MQDINCELKSRNESGRQVKKRMKHLKCSLFLEPGSPFVFAQMLHMHLMLRMKDPTEEKGSNILSYCYCHDYFMVMFPFKERNFADETMMMIVILNLK